MTSRKNPAAIALGRLGAGKGGRARAAKLTPEQRRESARKAVQARWAKVKESGRIASKTVSGASLVTSKKALHLCLKRLKNAKDDSEIRRLTEELQQIVFHRQYGNAKN